MFEELMARGRRAGERAADRKRRLLSERLGELAGISIEESERGVVLIGRGLRRRAIEDDRLRWIAGWLR